MTGKVIMNIGFKWSTQNPALSSLEQGLALANKANVKSLLILACADNPMPVTECNLLLQRLTLPVFGGIFPALIFSETVLTSGYIVIGFVEPVQIDTFENISRMNADEADSLYEVEIEQKLNFEADSYFLFHDAFSPNSEYFIDTLFYCLGDVKVIGAGCGSMDFSPRPCVFTNNGILQDVVQLAALSANLSVNVAHGWQILDGPYLVTESKAHQINSLNYQSAAEQYQTCIESVSEMRFTDQDFFTIAKNFPLGIQGANDEILVREIIKAQNGQLECVGNIPNNALVYILKGERAELVRAVQQSCEQFFATTVDCENLFVVDCIGRYLFLESEFTQELDAILSGSQYKDSAFGVLSLGEISNTQNGAIKLLNKSIVLGCF